MVIRFLLILILLAALPTAAQSPDKAADLQHFFPLVADGGGYQTFFFVANVSESANSCTMSLQGPGLDTVILEANAAITPADSGVNIHLDVDADLVVASTNRQALTFGYATLSCNQPAVARAVIVSKSAGTITAMTTVESMRLAGEFRLPVLSWKADSLALIISSNSTRDSSCSVELENEKGESIGGGSVSVPPKSTAVQSLNELIPLPDKFESGVVVLSCNRSTLGVVGLLHDGQSFTTVPAIGPSYPKDKLYSISVFPVVADGDGFQSRLFAFDLGGNSGRAHCALNLQRTGLDINRFEFTGDVRPSGTDAIVVIQGIPDDRFPEIRPFAQLASTGDQELSYGYVTLRCPGRVPAGLLLSYEETDQIVGLTTFPGAQTETDFNIPLIPRLGDSALFFANYWDIESSCEFTVRNNRQSILGEGSFSVPNRSSTVQFLGNLIPIPENFEGGSARISCDRRVAGMGLAISGPIFTSLPPVVLSPANPEPDTPLSLERTIPTRFTFGEQVSYPMAEAGGGNPPLIYSLAPPIPGLVFDQETRLLTGIPTELGVYDVAYVVTDVDGDTFWILFSIEVVEPDSSPDLTQAGGLADQTYDKDVEIENLKLPEAVGGNYPLVYDLSPSIPGLQFNAESRQLSGAPTTTGFYRMTYSVTDEDGDSDSVSFDLKVVVPISPADLIDVDGCENGRFTNGSSSSGLIRDCRALVAVANALIESGLNPEENPIRQWGRGEQVGMDAWAGIEVFQSRVTAISLDQQQLKGFIPKEIGQLNELTFLNLAGDYKSYSSSPATALIGEIPPELGNLDNLRYLNLENNQLSGNIPPELGKLGQLETLRLGANYLVGEIPTELGMLPNLQELCLESNALSGRMPPELGRLELLRIMRLGNNNLSGAIPAEFGKLSNLRDLQLFGNELSGVVPSELGNLRNLNNFRATGNQLEGAIPDTFSRLTTLRFLQLEGNRLSGEIPESLGLLPNLRRLGLDDNELTGEIPPSLGQISTLEYLDLSNNRISGTIPGELGNLTNLRDLRIANNELEGTIPAALGNLGNLWALSGHNNRLTGPIPPEFGNLHTIEILTLYANRLSGALPAELAALPNIRSLIVSSNNLKGPLPWAFRDLLARAGFTLDIRGNHIGGLGPPPANEERPSFSSNPAANGNAAHHSIAWFQGPLLFEWDWEGEQILHQTPILGRWAGLAVRIDHSVEQPPPVITRVLDAGDEVLVESLEESAPPTTEEIEPGQWRSEYVFHLPGEFFQTGNQIVHIIDPDDDLAETDETDNVSDAITLYGEKPPRLRVVFIPVQHPDQDIWYEDLVPETLMSGVRAFLPVADDFEARIGKAMEFRTERGIFNVLTPLLELWNMEAEPDEFYHALVNSPREQGIAFAPGQVAASAYSMHYVIPHELGHNLNLLHTPGCSARVLDLDYPYRDGQLGPGRGWNLNWRRFVTGEDKGYADVMSYCEDSKFISSYNYSKASDYWLAFEPGSKAGDSTETITTDATKDASPTADSNDESAGFSTLAASTSAEAGSLAFSGQISTDGVWSLGQAQLSEREPRPAPEDREFTLVLFDSAGIQLYSEPLALISLSEGDDSFWAARTPLPLRTAQEIAILDAQGNELLRETLPESAD